MAQEEGVEERDTEGDLEIREEGEGDLDREGVLESWEEAEDDRERDTEGVGDMGALTDLAAD